MQCRKCGAEIADKALICYRCGTATTDAKYQPASLQRSSRGGLVATVIALVLILVLFIVMGRVATSTETSNAVRYGAIAVAVVIVVLRAYARRRR